MIHVGSKIIGGSSELPVWLTDGFWVTFFWKVEGSSAHTGESRAAHMWQLTCMVITTIW